MRVAVQSAAVIDRTRSHIVTLDLTADLDVSSLEVLDYSQPANAFELFLGRE